MTSNLPSQSFRCAVKSWERRLSLTNRRPFIFSVFSSFSTSCRRRNDEFDNADKSPRWDHTPPDMIAPINSRIRTRKPFKVNDNPQILDDFYMRFLGVGGDKVLSEEVKWLAVTHKSFDHGRRGFNDRLAYFGRRIVELQASLAIIQSGSSAPASSDAVEGRKPFRHPALEGLENLTEQTKNSVTERTKLGQLGAENGLQDVIRWKPKKATNLIASGVNTVMAQTLYAIVGAIALERGGAAANQVVRERILKPLGYL